MRQFYGVLVLSTALAGAAWAHSGVKNPAVMARMNAMSGVQEGMKVLGDMAKQTRAFDAEAAQQAAVKIAGHAEETPALFEAQEDDPKSEARPAIWENFADFTAKSDAMRDTARAVSANMTSLDDVRAGLKQLGETCTACHKLYRE